MYTIIFIIMMRVFNIYRKKKIIGCNIEILIFFKWFVNLFTSMSVTKQELS